MARTTAANLPTRLAALLTIASGLLATGCASSMRGEPVEASALPLPFEVVAKSYAERWTGVAVSKEGRIFVNYPRWDGPYRNAVEELLPDGSRRPYPNPKMNLWRAGDDPSTGLVCVQSVHVDDKDRLWILDPASPNFTGVVEGGAKLIHVDLKTDAVVQTIAFDAEIAPRSSYLNDVRVDTKRNIAYITDSGLGAIIVVDLEAGTARRVLAGHSSTQAEAGFTPIIEGTPLRYGGDGDAPRIKSDGLALSPNREWLYYQALSARSLFRVPTDALLDDTLSPNALAQRVEYLGATVSTDGMAVDNDGNLYFSALEKNAIVVRKPDGTTFTLTSGDEISWPDSFAVDRRRGELYFTTAQIHKRPIFHKGDSTIDDPYLLLKVPTADRINWK